MQDRECIGLSPPFSSESTMQKQSVLLPAVKGLGSLGGRGRRQPISFRVLLPFLPLQREQAATTLSLTQMDIAGVSCRSSKSFRYRQRAARLTTNSGPLWTGASRGRSLGWS